MGALQIIKAILSSSSPCFPHSLSFRSSPVLSYTPTYHLLDAVETLAVETERLLKQHLILHSPLIRKGREVGQVGQRLLHVMLVPEQHAQRLKNREVIRVVQLDLLNSLLMGTSLFPICSICD